MAEQTEATDVWKQIVAHLIDDPEYHVEPRGMPVDEVLAQTYAVQMPAYINLKSRKVNIGFMLQEAAWIIRGDNWVSSLTPHIKGYARFSDDDQFLSGAYGPKVVDQMPYVIKTLLKDKDSRQAVMTIWRERPGESKDIPCTVAMQFLIRDNKLNMVTTMRSQDIVLGYTYDVFTFSMIARSIQLLLAERDYPDLELGKLYVTAGSLHLYESALVDAEKAIQGDEVDESVDEAVAFVMQADRFSDLVGHLIIGANNVREAKEAKKSV